MIYDVLASYYDALVKDDEATAAWVALIQRHMQGNEIMEVACGSGEITIALAQKGYHMHASDISPAMIRAAKAKPGAAMVDWRVMDMRQLQGGAYDGILCLCDSFNYLLEEAEVSSFFRSVYAHLREHGVFIVDMHSQDRLKEFAPGLFPGPLSRRRPPLLCPSASPRRLGPRSSSLFPASLCPALMEVLPRSPGGRLMWSAA